MAYIELFRDGEHSARIPLRRVETRIGRGADCDVVLYADYVSRTHCVLRRRGPRFELIDKSANGTLVNGRNSGGALLNDGDRIDIGAWALVLHHEAQAAGTETVRRSLESAGKVLNFNPSEGTVTVDGYELMVTDGPLAGERRALDSAALRIGRGEGCDWRLEDSSLDESHCELIIDGGLPRLRDLGSRRGTLVDGEPLAGERTLAPGADLRLGNLSLRLQRSRRSQALPEHDGDIFCGMVGSTPAMRRVFSLVKRVADQSVPVLILGETGTGKELVARALHDSSSRAAGPFIALNCGALPENLIESELFGHEQGAFTGARKAKLGAFRAADGGTLFLDEVGELPLHLQSRLLRVLETGEVTPLGSHKAHKPDVRIVAATHRDLAKEAAAGEFRSDLFYRLFVVPVHLPPLRERREDIPLLVRHLLNKMSPGTHVDIDREAAELLRGYHWDGNVRSLQNTLLRAVATRQGDRITTEDLVFPPSTRSTGVALRWPSMGVAVDPEEEGLTRVERAMRRAIIEAMEEADGSRRKAATLLGIARSTLYERLENLRIV